MLGSTAKGVSAAAAAAATAGAVASTGSGLLEDMTAGHQAFGTKADFQYVHEIVWTG